MSLLRSPGDPERSAVKVALRWFAFGAAMTLVVLVGVSMVSARMLSRTTALDEAKFRTMAIADYVAAPMITDRFRRDVEDANQDLTRLMNQRMKDPSIRHIKIWDSDGTILWADEGDLVGQRFPLSAEEQRALESGAAVSHYSDLDRDENAGEREDGPTLETYVGAEAADHSRILFETYIAPDSAIARQAPIIRTSLLVGLACLLVFGVAVLPLSLRLARRVERAGDERDRMTRRALMASELERRRIAQGLHDGVIQDLAGAGYVLPGVTDRMRTNRSDPQDADVLTRLQDVVGRNVQRLRAMMTEVYPPDLGRESLHSAVMQLVQDAGEKISVQIHIDEDLVLAPGPSQLAYRVVREGLRNVVKHADAQHVVIEVRKELGVVHVVVADDGKGICPASRNDDGDELPTEDGHLGLTLIRDSVLDAGGRLELVPNQPQGTRLRASFDEDVPGF